MPIPPPPTFSQPTTPAPVQQPSSSLAPSSPGQNPNALQLTQENLNLIKKTLVPSDITDTEFSLFVEVCRRRGLDPFAKHVFAVKRSGKLVIQTSIDGYRLIAERTGKYLGQSAPEWCGEDGKWVDVWTQKSNPFACRLGVFKSGHQIPTIAIAYWNSYVAPGPFWQKSGPSQLAKCCEALALRKAFPEDLSGLYTSEEMQQADPSEATIVSSSDVPLSAEEVQPVMIFPKEVVAENDSGALIKDAKGTEWVFPKMFNQALEESLSNQGFLLVYYIVETGRRVVTGLGAL